MRPILMKSSRSIRPIPWLLLVLIANVGWATSTALGGVDERRSPVVVAIAKVQPSVVSITSEKRANSNARWPFSPDEMDSPRVNGMGTGVIIDARGFVLTNHHVVDRVRGVQVHLHDGTVYNAHVVQQDPAMDVALLKVDADRPLVPVAIGSSADLMEGETVITIGNAFGYENTKSVGIVSALGRNVTLSDDQVYRNLIQTDACINPGNSGGPLINIDGELIGINVAVRAGAQGIGFALPIDDVKRVAVEMMSTRRLASTWHGLVATEVRGGSGRRLVLADVLRGSPAEEAGFLRGDEVVRVGEVEATNPIDVERGLLDVRPGSRANVVVRRGDEEKTLAIEPRRVGEAAREPVLPASNSEDAGDELWKALGVQTVPVSRDYVRIVSENFKGGLYVREVALGSPAARASLRKGDILVGMNVGSRDWETIRPENVLYLLKRYEPSAGEPMTLYLVRQNVFVQERLSYAGGDGGEVRR